ncbi:hypothetical protein PC116_g26167 [Phytophthora cactorum]|nr:hypothetical protein PC116_g26167 [Phytophthora cactorum]
MTLSTPSRSTRPAQEHRVPEGASIGYGVEATNLERFSSGF